MAACKHTLSLTHTICQSHEECVATGGQREGVDGSRGEVTRPPLVLELRGLRVEEGVKGLDWG